jgi:hypothetical protein
VAVSVTPVGGALGGGEPRSVGYQTCLRRAAAVSKLEARCDLPLRFWAVSKLVELRNGKLSSAATAATASSARLERSHGVEFAGRGGTGVATADDANRAWIDTVGR